jgi:trehalose 6-phosphate phosphatase
LTAVSSTTDVARRLATLFKAQPGALFSDFDGTLSPVAPTPDSAVAAPGVAETLSRLAERLSLVGIVSGRGVDDAMNRIAVPDLLYVGNHGLEWHEHDEHHVHPSGLAAEEVLPEALRDIEQRLQAQVTLDGIIFENKRYSASVHYRLSADPGRAGEILRPILHEVAADYGFWVADGKMVFELRPGAGVNKGSAVRQIVTERELQSAVFLGDDVTDADAFIVLRQLRDELGIQTCTIGVLTLDTDQRVIENSDFLLDGVDDVVSMLLELVHLLPNDDDSPE